MCFVDQEHLKDAVEGTLRLKRLLSQDSEAEPWHSLRQCFFSFGLDRQVGFMVTSGVFGAVE